jgi:hypothetical protein
MKSFKQYLAESKREYGYVLKLAIEPTLEQMAMVTNYLSQFNLVEITKPSQLAGDRLDFIDIPNARIFQVNFITTTPVSSYVTMEGLREVLNVPEKMIVLRTATEPVEMNADRGMTDHGFDAIAKERGLKSAARLSTDRLYQDIEQPEVRDAFGNAYNKKFLDYLADVAKTRPTDQYEPPAPLFSWLDMNKVKELEPKQDTADFNERYDTPKPVYAPSGKMTEPIDAMALGVAGNFDDGSSHLYRFYKDERGDRVNMGAPRAPNKPSFIRKG